MHRYIAATLMLLALSFPVRAQECGDAKNPVDNLATFGAALASNNVAHIVMTGDLAARWLAAFNALPPASDIRADTIVRVPMGEGNEFLFFFAAGCPVVNGSIDRGGLRQIEAALGRGA